jgi:hypothetical protein
MAWVEDSKPKAILRARVVGVSDGGGALIPPEVIEKALREYQGDERRGLVYRPSQGDMMGRPRLSDAVGLVTGVEREGEGICCEVEILNVPAAEYILAAAAVKTLRAKVVPTVHVHTGFVGVTSVELDRDVG